jgi:uncharacterized paraquat-inducible protein A
MAVRLAGATVKRLDTYKVVALASVALLAVTVATVSVVNHASERAGCAILIPFSGGTIATSLVVLVLAGSALMRQCRTRPKGMDERLERRACDSCGHEVYGAWRMCPYCGAMLASDNAIKRNEAAS